MCVCVCVCACVAGWVGTDIVYEQNQMFRFSLVLGWLDWLVSWAALVSSGPRRFGLVGLAWADVLRQILNYWIPK